MRKLSTEDFTKRAEKIHHGHYTYANTVYAGAINKLTVTCPVHGDFQQTADAHLSGKGCPVCRPLKASITRSLKTPEFIRKAVAVHGDTYSYAAVECMGGQRPVVIRCPLHGDFNQKPRLHLLGCGCPTCGVKRRAFQSMYTTSDFVQRARRVHGNGFDYADVEYCGAFKLVSIRCRKHGIFKQQPTSHLSGHGCPACHSERSSAAQRHNATSLLARCREVHGTAYTYDFKNYRNQSSHIGIVCQKHGLFKQAAKRHLNGDGCPACGCHESAGETELFDWVRSLCPDAVARSRSIIGPAELDVYVPSARIAIEYNGMYWHSCDPLGRSRSPRDYKKWLDCRKQNIDLFVVWEETWKKQRPVIEHWLRHKLGKSPRLCGARQAELAEPAASEAAQFYEKYHLQGRPQSPVATCGLRYKGQWVAMATFSKSPERGVRMAAHTFYFSRLALAGSVPGGASRLVKELIRRTGAREVQAHSDNSYADGSVKATLGFKEVGTLPPRYRVWHPKYGLRHRIFWQKGSIAKRMAELKLPGVPDLALTTYALHAACGCRHVWDFGKTRWKWTADSVL